MEYWSTGVMQETPAPEMPKVPKVESASKRHGMSELWNDGRKAHPEPKPLLKQ
jgi:hypothetical protein